MKRGFALGAVALAAVAALVFGLLRGSGGAAPPDEAARLVPADALVYVHLSTDPDRDSDDELLKRLGRLPSFARARTLIEEAVKTQGGLDLRRDVRPWLGDEAAFALLASGGTVAPSLLLLAAKDEGKAKAALERISRGGTAGEHRGVAIKRFNGIAGALTGGFLAIGQEPAVQAAIERSQARGTALAGAARWTRARAGAPGDRSLDAYFSPEGVQRVLRPQAGLLGAAGAAIDDPALEGAGLTVSSAEGGLRARLRVLRSKASARPFEPKLLDRVPETAFAYLGLGGLDSVTALLPRSGLEGLMERAREALPPESGVDLDRDVLEPLRGEVAVSATLSLPFPQVTLIARTRDEKKTRDALGRLQGVLAEALGSGGEEGAVPTFEERRLDGVTAYAVKVGPTFEVLYAVSDGLLIVSTTAAGIERAREDGASLREAEPFERAVGEPEADSEALVFLDLRQLLTLGDLAGLTDSGALRNVREDLGAIRTAGAAARREGNDTIAEFFLEIP
jgi:hypothetical protein